MAKQAEGTIQNVIDQAKDAAAAVADQTYEAGATAYREGSEIVSERPGSALLAAGLIGFALGIIVAKGSQPPRPRTRWQRYYSYD
jgi:ElaB/YqjD/DUF883 family membrane-anchored ribosome-binding protein